MKRSLFISFLVILAGLLLVLLSYSQWITSQLTGNDFDDTSAQFPAPVPKTGQTTVYRTGDDGYWQKGVAWPIPWFTDNGDGTVTDNLTGLMWTQNANLDGEKTWEDAIDHCNELTLAGYSD